MPEVGDSKTEMEGIKDSRKPLRHKQRIGGQGYQSECRSLDQCLYVLSFTGCPWAILVGDIKSEGDGQRNRGIFAISLHTVSRGRPLISHLHLARGQKERISLFQYGKMKYLKSAFQLELLEIRLGLSTAPFTLKMQCNSA